MRASQRIKVFTDRYPLIGPTFWVVDIQYFITQVIVAAAWRSGYSWRHNAISDLGNTACGAYGGRFVCSPLHDWMNASFIVLGLTMIAGSTLIYHEFRRQTAASALGFGGMALAGIGTALVGLFPENVAPHWHFIGALLPFTLGNLALIIFGVALGFERWLSRYSVTSGATGLLALVLLLTHHYFVLGFGGMERLVAYPQTLWLIIFGLYMSRNEFRAAYCRLGAVREKV